MLYLCDSHTKQGFRMRRNVLAAFFLLVAVSSVNAATYKGQKVYIDNCKDCHGGGQEIAGAKVARTWEKFMDNKGQKLADVHLSSKKAEASHEYFESKKYTKDSKHLADFLEEYSRDSGNVPACN
jgi:phosphopentomutase